MSNTPNEIIDEKPAISFVKLQTLSSNANMETIKEKNWRKKLLNDIWWKILITVAVAALLIFVIYKVVQDNKTSSPKRNISDGRKLTKSKTPKSFSTPTAITETKITMLKCREGSIVNSYAFFTFQPSDGSKPYQVHGLEFSFGVLAKKIRLALTLTKLNKITAGSSNIHYYYNIDRCYISGAIQIHKQPIIRGPLVFAVDKECSKVYYFVNGSGWRNFNSAGNMTCSSHAKPSITTSVNTSPCVEGSIKNSYSSFTYQPFLANQPYRANGLEFSFNMVAKKANLESTLIRLSKLTSASSDIHYYYNIDRCNIGGGIQVDKQPYIRGPIVFAVDQECGKVYYFQDRSWTKYYSARNITCSRHGRGFCTQGSRSSRWVSFTSSSKDAITGLEFQYNVLAKKLQGSSRKIQPIDISTNTGWHYFLNMEVCPSIELADYANPHNTRPPLILAVNEECTMTYMFDEHNLTWERETQAGPLTCSWINSSWCYSDSVDNSSATFEYFTFDGKKPKVIGIQYNFTSMLQKLQGLDTADDLTKVQQINSEDVTYYLNLNRCLNGGPANLATVPQIRGALFFAVSANCSKVHYFSSTYTQWKTYNSAFNIIC